MVTKCVNCGEPMTSYYARSGETIFMCPNVRIKIKKHGILSYGFKFCEKAKSLQPLIVDPKEAIALHAKFESLKEAFETMTTTLTIEQLREATYNTLSDINLLTSANLALM